MAVVGVSVLECVADVAVWTRDRLTNIVCASQMELPVSAVVEALMAEVTLKLETKTKAITCEMKQIYKKFSDVTWRIKVLPVCMYVFMTKLRLCV